MKLLSIAIPCFNSESYMRHCVETLLTGGEDVEIIIVDDGSTNKEQFMEIVGRLKKEDDRIRYIDLEKNYGKWYALNKAIETTDAQVCTAHDADDISLPDRIDMQALALLGSKTQHNLCGFHHCWNEEDVEKNIDTFKAHFKTV